MRTEIIDIYTIDEHPNKELCFDWIRNNWHDINQYSVYEVIQSIKALSDKIGGTNDYCISQVPDRGEYITFEDYDKEVLNSIDADDCPLTGVFWDIDLIKGLRNGNPSLVLDSLHSDTEYQYSDEGLTDMCKANGYEFYSDGSIV